VQLVGDEGTVSTPGMSSGEQPWSTAWNAVAGSPVAWGVAAAFLLAAIVVTIVVLRRGRASRGFETMASGLGMGREEMQRVRQKAAQTGVSPITLLLVHGRGAAS
jgi:hypothetical protein